LESTKSSKAKVNGKQKILYVAGILLLLTLGLFAIVSGGVLLFLNAGNDFEGYTISPIYHINSSTNAYVLWVTHFTSRSSFSWLGTDNIAQAKWVVTSVGGSQIFAGWAEASNGNPYVYSFQYQTPYLWNYSMHSYYAKLTIPENNDMINGVGSPSSLPANETFWLDYVTTADMATLHYAPSWDINRGYRMLIIMNADGSSGINVNLQLGFKVPILTWLPNVIIPAGSVLCFGGLFLTWRYKKAKQRIAEKAEK
jgi:hypothetical protein